MNNVKIFLLVVVALMATGCGTSCGKMAKDKSEQLAGGYTEQRALTEEESAMFRSVTGGGEISLTPLTVATQVVAGTNYKFQCKYQDNSGSGRCLVVIFRPLPGRGDPTLVSIEKE